MKLDIDSNKFLDSPISAALRELRNQIQRLRMLEQIFAKEQGGLFDELKDFPNSDEVFPFENKRLLWVFAIHDCTANIVDLSTGIIRALDGETEYLVNLRLRPTSPIEGMAEKIAEESPTLDEVDQWVGRQSRPS